MIAPWQTIWPDIESEGQRLVELAYADAGVEIYPPREQVFRALEMVAPDQVKVVILGQDPYHGPGQAHGLSFSVPDGEKLPPSLRNIFKEIATDVGGAEPKSRSPDLTPWAEQGVLLLNATLSVCAGQAGSHAKLGWQDFTTEVIRRLNEHRDGVVYMLWGAHAQRKRDLLDADNNLILEAVHPSPLSASRGFFGCQHFSKANAYLESRQQTPIKW